MSEEEFLQHARAVAHNWAWMDDGIYNHMGVDAPKAELFTPNAKSHRDVHDPTLLLGPPPL